VLVASLTLGACTPPLRRPAVAAGPSPSERLAAADLLLKAGCFDCLAGAYREYDTLRSVASASDAATVGAARAAALLAIRERELGTEDSGYLNRAQELAAPTGAAQPALPLLLQIAETLPTRGAGRQVNDDIELARMQTGLRNRDVWTEQLRTRADADPLTAYLWLGFNCAYVPASQQNLDEWLARIPSWRDTPLIAFKAAICGSFDSKSLDRLFQSDARFVELNYYLGLSATFAGKIDDAMNRLQRAYVWRPRWPAVTNSLAGDYVSLEDFDTAIEFYDRTLAVVPSFADALLDKTKAQTYAGKPADAIVTADRLLALGHWFVGDARYWRALNETQLGQHDAAWDDVELAAKLIQNAAVPKLAGIIAYRRHQLDVARGKFEESRGRNREDCETGFYLGIVLGEQAVWSRTAEVLGETGACLVKAEKSLNDEIANLRASPTDHPDRQARQILKREQQIASGRRMMATSWFNIAVSYYSLKRNDEARQYAERVIDDEQFGERARDLLSRLR
jgi:tetratricopeptide (TPR) repeat protein